jgi:hypothetical protein
LCNVASSSRHSDTSHKPQVSFVALHAYIWSHPALSVHWVACVAKGDLLLGSSKNRRALQTYKDHKDHKDHKDKTVYFKVNKMQDLDLWRFVGYIAGKSHNL